MICRNIEKIVPRRKRDHKPYSRQKRPCNLHMDAPARQMPPRQITLARGAHRDGTAHPQNERTLMRFGDHQFRNSL